MPFLSLVTLTFDLTFKLVRARDQTRLPCEFGANPFSGSRDFSYTNKKQTDGAKNGTCRSSLRAVKTTPLNTDSDYIKRQTTGNGMYVRMFTLHVKASPKRRSESVAVEMALVLVQAQQHVMV